MTVNTQRIYVRTRSYPTPRVRSVWSYRCVIIASIAQVLVFAELMEIIFVELPAHVLYRVFIHSVSTVPVWVRSVNSWRCWIYVWLLLMKTSSQYIQKPGVYGHRLVRGLYLDTHLFGRVPPIRCVRRQRTPQLLTYWGFKICEVSDLESAHQ